MKSGSFLFSFIVLLFFFSTLSRVSVAESPEEFIDSFIQTSFESENWNKPDLFFDEIKNYFDFHIIGRNLLGAGFRYFNKNQFDNFVKIYPPYEVYDLLSHLEDLENHELNFTLVRQKTYITKYGSMFKFYYNYKKISSRTNNSSDSGRINFTIIKRKNQEHYKIVNLGLNGVNWLAHRRRHYIKLIQESEKNPDAIIRILRKKTL